MHYAAAGCFAGAANAAAGCFAGAANLFLASMHDVALPGWAVAASVGYGLVVWAPSAVIARRANLVTDDLAVNGLGYAAAALALVWLGSLAGKPVNVGSESDERIQGRSGVPGDTEPHLRRFVTYHRA